MADIDYFGADYGVDPASRFLDAVRNFGLVNWAGAVTSLALTAGMATWAVDLTFRDVSAVPVIRAIEGPMRVAPENPGGATAPYQGLALSDITSGGAAAAAPDQIALAPPAPVLAERPMAERAAQAVAAAADAADGAEASVELPTGMAAGEVEALVDKLAATTTPLEVATAATARLDAAAEASSTDPVDLTGQSTDPDDVLAAAIVADVASSLPVEAGLSRSVRPARRPARAPARAQVVASAATPADPASAAPVAEIGPAEVKPGDRLAQIGAFDSEAIALEQWAVFQDRFGAYMDGKGRVVQRASSGGRDFWRLRVAGFADGGDARRFCAALSAGGAACIPVVAR